MLKTAVLFVVTWTALWPATARAEPQLFPILQALSSPGAQAKLDPSTSCKDDRCVAEQQKVEHPSLVGPASL
jgi:hypothetical protein